jgi:tetratricopeptide (TPR) repeat protein
MHRGKVRDTWNSGSDKELMQALRGLSLVCLSLVCFPAFLALGQNLSEDRMRQARALLSQGRLTEAKQAAVDSLETNQQSADAHFLLGYILFKQQDAKASLAEYTEGAKYRKPTAAELEVVAGDYVLLSDYPDADRWFSTALDLNPNDALGWYYLGRVKYNENRFEEALSAFGRCLALDARNVKAEDNMGLAFQGLGRNAEAIAAYRKALEWQADSAAKDSGPYLDLGSLLVDDGDTHEGLPLLMEAERISPADFRMHRQLGKAYMRLGQLENAQAELAKAIELAPNNAPLHFMLAQVYHRRGMRDQAKAETERYSALGKDDPGKDKE